jgi:cytochrome b subunit of formate dehydrogenase
MIKKLIFGLMWFVVIFIVTYVGTGLILVLLVLGPETNQIKYEAAQMFRNTYMIFFIIGSLILAILGTITGLLPGTKKKHSAKKKTSTKKKSHKKK